MILARSGAAAVAVALLCAGQAVAATKVVSFDDLDPGTKVDTQYQASHGVYFQGPSAGDGWLPLIKSVPGLAHSGDQVADVSDCPGQSPGSCEGSTPRSVGRLTTSARTVSAYVGMIGSTGMSSSAVLTAFNSDGASLGSSSTSVTEGQPFNQQLSVTSPSPTADIASFELRGEPFYAGIAMDDLSITTPDTPPPPDIALSVSSDPATVRQADYVDVPISLTRLNGSNGDVTLSVSGLPPGMTAAFTPNPVPGTESNATLRLSAELNAPPTSYTEITITATPGDGAGSSSRSATKLVRIVENCERTVRLDYIDARTDGCMQTAGPNRVVAANQTVHLNGLELSPEDGTGELTIDKAARTISSDGTDYEVTPIGHPHMRIDKGAIDWNLGGAGDRPKQVIDSTSRMLIGGGEEPIVDIFLGFRVDRVTAALTKAGRAEVRPTLKLGFWPFNYFGATSVTPEFTTDNDHGADFGGLALKLERVTALAFELKNVTLSYNSADTWSGGATAVLRFANPYEITAAFGLRDGGFDFLNGSVSGLNIAVGPGIFLQRLGFGVRTDPLSIEGSARFSAGPSIKGAQLIIVDGVLKADFADPFVISLTGKASLVNRFDLANVFVRYSSTGLFELGGSLDWDLKVAYINGSVYGFVDGLDAASLEGSVRGCIAIPWAPDPCAAGKVIASNIGIAACVEIVYAEAGIGYFWGDDFDLFWGSCDLSRWRPAQGAARTAATRRFRLRRGLSRAAFAVEGIGGAPGVTLTGPHGERISVSASTPKARSGNLFAVQGGNDTSYVVIKRPAAGIWRLTDDGSVPIRRVRQAFGLPHPAVRADVSGTGRRRVLHWRLRVIAGQRVRFVEAGGGVHRVITTTRARSGHVNFRPADGRAGRRRLVALVEQDGLPRATIRLGSFRAPGRPRPSRPLRPRVRHRGTRLRVSWRGPRDRFRHAVYVAIADGRRIVRIAPAGARAVTIRGVAAGYGARATITGLTSANGRGPSARASIAGRAARPASGRWHLARAFHYVSDGRFEVSRSRDQVLGLRVMPGGVADSGCGTSRLRVAATLRVRRSTRAGEAIRIVGRPAPRRPDGVDPIRVPIRQAGKRVRATLELAFGGRRRAAGTLRTKGCRLYFEARR